jgi:hypothetical protein
MSHSHIDPLVPSYASAPTRLGAGSWMIIMLLSLLVATGFVVYLGWTLGDRIEVSTAGFRAAENRGFDTMCGLMSRS